MSLEISMDPDFKKAIDRAQEVGSQIKKLNYEIAMARKEYYENQTNDKAKSKLKSLVEAASELHKELGQLVAEAQRIAGIPDELLEALEEDAVAKDGEIRIERQSLTIDKLPPTEFFDRVLPQGLERIYRLVDLKWLHSQRDLFQKMKDSFLRSPLSIVRGLRIESEFPSIHRFAQAIFVCQDYLDEEQNTDIFASALLVPQTASLGWRLPLLREVGGDTKERIEKLWRGESEEVDSTVFELLVASACVAMGREMEFLKETEMRSPDLRVHDYPFPLVVECKRKRVLRDYEILEEQRMSELFGLLHKNASARNLWGIFELELGIEPIMAPIEEIVLRSIYQRLAASPEKPTTYEWGSIAFFELPKKVSIPKTRLYSPIFLENVFFWNSDLPTHDGMLCKTVSSFEFLVDIAEEPIALKWRSNSSEAIKNRSWSPVDLLGNATNQIPLGEVGIIYICYQEGGREWIADHRTNSFISRIKNWAHSGGIRVPLSILTRIYPRLLGHGAPDLIENALPFISDLYGDRAYLADFPSVVFKNPSN
jgi:hypothetical protein